MITNAFLCGHGNIICTSKKRLEYIKMQRQKEQSDQYQGGGIYSGRVCAAVVFIQDVCVCAHKCVSTSDACACVGTWGDFVVVNFISMTVLKCLI